MKKGKSKAFLRVRGKTSKRLMLVLRFGFGIATGNPKSFQVLGKEHINEIPKEKSVIISSTHISDWDAFIAIYILGKDFDIKIADLASHHNILQDPVYYVTLFLGGERNFIPITTVKENKKFKPRFNTADFDRMEKVLKNGKALYYAAHNPTYDTLPEKGGIGSLFLAQLTNSVILPVAVDTDVSRNLLGALKRLKRKPKTTVTIGKPLVVGVDLEKINAVKMRELQRKKETGQKLNLQEKTELKTIKRKLFEQSNEVMGILAEMLPAEKRGPYGILNLK